MNQLSYQAQPSSCNVVNHPIWNACVRDSLPARGIPELVPSLQPWGEAGCFCVYVSGPCNLFWCSAKEKKRLVCTPLLCGDTSDRHLEGISLTVSWVPLRGSVGCRIRPCVVQPKTMALAMVLPLSLCPTVRCLLAPPCLCFTCLTHPLCKLLRAETGLCNSMCRNQVFMECRGADFILLLIINNITT